MKVKTNTDHTLIVEEIPWLFTIMIVVMILAFTGIGLGLVLSGEWFGLIFAAAGVFFMPLFLFIFARRVQVVFYRPDGWMEIRRANILRKSKSRFDIDEVDRAIVQSTMGDSGRLYRVTLLMKTAGIEGEKPLTMSYSNVGKHHEVAEAINAWLSTYRAAQTSPSRADFKS